MGWFSRIGSAIKGGVQKLGHAVHHGVDQATRLVDKIAPKVETIANKVASGAGVVGRMAGIGALATAEVPVVGEVLGAISGGAKVVQGAAMAVGRGAQFAKKASSTVKRIERDVGEAADMGKKLLANPNMTDAVKYKNQVSHMVRSNQANIQDARQHFNNIRSGRP